MSGMKTMQAFKFRICPTPVPSAPSLPPCGVRAVRLEQGIGPPEGTGRRGDPPFVLRGSGQAPDALEKQLGVWLPVQGAGPSAAVGPHRFLDRALWDGLTKKKGFPRFKKKRNGDALRFPDALQIKLDMTEKDPDGRGVFPRIFVPKVGGIRFRKSREICGTVKTSPSPARPGDGRSPSRRRGRFPNQRQESLLRWDSTSGWRRLPPSRTEPGFTRLRIWLKP